MISRDLWPLLLATGVAPAATLPFSPGTYVQAGVPCDDPPFAATFDYDGHRFSYPHASKCRSAVVSHQDRVSGSGRPVPRWATGLRQRATRA